MKRIYKPESLMSSFGYEPQWSEGAIKPPVFHSSTFCFKSAEQGKAFFETAYGLNAGDLEKDTGLIYSRINNPNIEIVENRISLLDYAEETALFSSGMSAISTVLLEFLKPGDLLLFSRPVYGGTDHLIQTYLNDFGIKSIGFGAKDSFEDIIKMVEDSGHGDNLSVIFVESPANPTNDIFDLRMLRAIGDYFSTSNKKVYLGVDNTFMGPLWCSPLNLGADLVIYSATKYLGGHSDLIAGAVSGDSELITRIKNLRTFLGCIPGPETAWLLSRSLETLHVRMRMQMENAKQIADLLSMHPGVSNIHYLGLIPGGTREFDLYKRQYSAPGAMISFEIKGGEREAFEFINRLKLFKIAVSLGSTESLVQHPATMTHAGVPELERMHYGISSSLVRLSIGLENIDDLLQDIASSLDHIQAKKLRLVEHS